MDVPKKHQGPIFLQCAPLSLLTWRLLENQHDFNKRCIDSNACWNRGNAKLGTIVEPRLERFTLPIYRYIYIYIIYIYMYTWEPTTFIFRGYIFVGLKPAFFHGFGVHPGSPVLDYFFHGFSVKTIVFVRVYSVGYVSSLEGSPFYNRDQHGWIGVNLSMTKYQWNPWSIGFWIVFFFWSGLFRDASILIRDLEFSYLWTGTWAKQQIDRWYNTVDGSEILHRWYFQKNYYLTKQGLIETSGGWPDFWTINSISK